MIAQSEPVRVRVLYGSQTGNSRGIAAQVSEELSKVGFDAPVAGLDQFKKIGLEKERYAVIICSTTGNGDAPENAEAFVRFVKSKRTPAGAMEGVTYAVLGIGDTNYDQYQAIPRVIDARLEKLGACRLLPRAEADEATGLESTVEPWVPKLVTALSQLRDSDANGTRLAATAAAPAAPAKGVSANADAQDGPAAAAPAGAAAAVKEGGDARAAAAAAKAEAEAEASAKEAEAEALAEVEEAAEAVWSELPGGSAARPYEAAVLEAKWLTRDEDGRRVMAMVLDISGCKGPALRSFIPGDALAVLPTNPADEVGACLALLGLHGADADAQIPPPTSDVPAHLRRPLSARLALAERVDIGTAAGWPRPPLLKLLAGHATDSAERGRLHALLAEPSKARARRLATNPSLAQLLADHPSARPPLAALLDALPPLAERYYSIASSPLSAPDSARIVFTALSYSVRLPDGTCEQRRGLCSSQLADKGEALNASGGWVKPTVRVYRRRPTGNELRLPRELGTPVIMVGPGTGVAPFIAFLQHRRALALQGKAAVSAATGGKFAGASGPVGQAHLFFGCQHRVGDFLFDDELDVFERDGTLTRLHTAFSRDAIDSASAGEWRSVRLNVNYVQDLFLNAAALIQGLLLKEGAHVYVCGDGRSMAADVHSELLAVLQLDCGGGRPASSAAEADALLAQLAAAGRYTREIWY